MLDSVTNSYTGEERRQIPSPLGSFFPEMGKPHESTTAPALRNSRRSLIIEVDIEQSLKAAKLSTAPREDGLPTLLWEHLRKFLGTLIS